jgi:hypothetical protein
MTLIQLKVRLELRNANNNSRVYSMLNDSQRLHFMCGLFNGALKSYD